jgi:hypothetical protein
VYVCISLVKPRAILFKNAGCYSGKIITCEKQVDHKIDPRHINAQTISEGEHFSLVIQSHVIKRTCVAKNVVKKLWKYLR